jgi:hypothetical protein
MKSGLGLYYYMDKPMFFPGNERERCYGNEQ